MEEIATACLDRLRKTWSISYVPQDMKELLPLANREINLTGDRL
jgi:hypothetical protein